MYLEINFVILSKKILYFFQTNHVINLKLFKQWHPVEKLGAPQMVLGLHVVILADILHHLAACGTIKQFLFFYLFHLYKQRKKLILFGQQEDVAFAKTTLWIIFKDTAPTRLCSLYF